MQNYFRFWEVLIYNFILDYEVFIYLLGYFILFSMDMVFNIFAGYILTFKIILLMVVC